MCTSRKSFILFKKIINKLHKGIQIKVSQFFLIMTLCLGLNSIDACQLEGVESEPSTNVARFPLLVHYHEKAGDNKDV